MRKKIAAFVFAFVLIATWLCPSVAFAEDELQWQDFNGKKIGVLTGTPLEAVGEEFFPDSELLYFNSYPDCSAALLSGTIAAYLADEPSAKMTHFEQPKINYIPERFTENNYAFAFRKNDEEIRKYRVEDRWWLAHELANDDYYDELKRMIGSGEDIPFSLTEEYAPKVIRAIETGIPFRANLNVMNTGLISNMPADCCVEVPCYCDSEGIHPCYVGPLPDGPLGLNMSNVAVQKLQARAANEKKLEWIYQSIQLDPFTAAQCSLEQIRAMTSELIENNRAYLEGFR